MPRTQDFRNFSFDFTRVVSAGRAVGKDVYPLLYAIENCLRVLIHSVLEPQIGSNWWSLAVSADMQRRVSRNRATYSARPWHGPPGGHEIYYTFLPDLAEIIRVHAHLFRVPIPDIDQWIARIDQIRLPRNVVGHMNWPSLTDRRRAEVFLDDIQALLDHVSSAGLVLAIP